MLSKAEMIRRLRALPRNRKIQIASDQSYALMICQFHFRRPNERESTQSFKINLQRNGKFAAETGYCFGCGKYVGNFETILDPTKDNSGDEYKEDDSDSYAQPLYNETLDPILRDEDEEEIKLPNTIPWGPDDWRSISSDVMKSIKAQYYYEEEQESLMAYLPCMVKSQHVGGIRANLEKKGKRNYFNLPGSWVKEQGLFPYDATVSLLKEKLLSTIVLVEGPRDALRCLMFGIPAMAILGTNNWSESKAELVIRLKPKRVIIAMDGDLVGRKAAKNIYKSLSNEIDTYNFDFTKYGEELDPGNCPHKIMKKLRSFCI